MKGFVLCEQMHIREEKTPNNDDKYILVMSVMREIVSYIE